MDTLSAVEVLHEVDPRFVALVETMFGKAVDPYDAWAWMYQAPIAKAMPDMADMATPGRKRMSLVPTGMAKKKPTPPAAVGAPAPLMKAADPDEVSVVWAGEFTKADVEKRQAFGWASVVEVNGEPVVDLQGDWIAPEDIEKAAYAYVQDSRVGGDQHRKDATGTPIRAGQLIESLVVTDEKAARMGLPDDMPRGWWVGFQYEDGETWDDIKSGRKTGFSVHGKGRRIPVAV